MISRPYAVKPGNPGPWETDPRSVPPLISVAKIEEALSHAGYDSVPDHYLGAFRGENLTARQRHVADTVALEERSTSAVLVPLFAGESGEARMILTRRSSSLRSHTGEVAFPGGMADEGEAPVDAALREAYEEICLDPASVRVVGHIDAMPTIASNTWIVPYIGVLDSGRPELRANPDEVERVFDVSFDELFAPGVYHEELWEFPVFGFGPVHFFEVDGDTIWGATARMIRSLIGVILQGTGAPGE